MTDSPGTDRLREVVTEAIDAVIDGWMQGDPWPDDERLADAVLAALLPVHRAMVLTEAADELSAEIAQWERYGDGADKLALGRLIGMDGAAAIVRRLAASTPPGTPGSPQTAERATPEETGEVEPQRCSAGCDDCDEVCDEKRGRPGCTAPARFWTCPILSHVDRRGPNGELAVTVEWDGVVACCTAPGCGRSSDNENEQVCNCEEYACDGSCCGGRCSCAAADPPDTRAVIVSDGRGGKMIAEETTLATPLPSDSGPPLTRRNRVKVQTGRVEDTGVRELAVAPYVWVSFHGLDFAVAWHPVPGDSYRKVVKVIPHAKTPAAAVADAGDDPAGRERLTVDISRDLRASAQDMRAERRNTDAVLLTEAADKLDGLIALLAQAETERDEWKHRATELQPAAIYERESLRSENVRLRGRLDTAQTAYLAQADELAEARRERWQASARAAGWLPPDEVERLVADGRARVAAEISEACLAQRDRIRASASSYSGLRGGGLEEAAGIARKHATVLPGTDTKETTNDG